MQNGGRRLDIGWIKGSFLLSFSREKLCLAAFSFICSFSLTFPFWASGQSLFLCFLEAVPLSFVVFLVVSVLLRVGFRVGIESFSSKARLFALSAASFAVLWGGVYLSALYPGCFSTDSNDILKMLWGVPFQSEWFRYDSLNNHHPAFYIVLNYLAVSLGQFLGFTEMKCVALISILHLVTLAACCGFAVLKVNSLFKRKSLTLFCWAFFLWDPLLGWYSVTMWKDVIFSGVFVCFALLLRTLLLLVLFMDLLELHLPISPRQLVSPCSKLLVFLMMGAMFQLRIRLFLMRFCPLRNGAKCIAPILLTALSFLLILTMSTLSSIN